LGEVYLSDLRMEKPRFFEGKFVKIAVIQDTMLQMKF
jgi:hypothetical protein